jgi:hypothetical protein
MSTGEGDTMFPRWLGTLVGTVMGLVVGGAMVYMVGVRAHVWDSAPGGFWLF